MRQASYKALVTLTATALIAVIGAPVHQAAYGITEDQLEAENSTIVQNENEGASETSVPDNENPQSDGIAEDETPTIATMVRTANSTTEAINQDVRAIPSTVALALGLAAAALVFVVFRVKA